MNNEHICMIYIYNIIKFLISQLSYWGINEYIYKVANSDEIILLFIYFWHQTKLTPMIKPWAKSNGMPFSNAFFWTYNAHLYSHDVFVNLKTTLEL